MPDTNRNRRTKKYSQEHLSSLSCKISVSCYIETLTREKLPASHANGATFLNGLKLNGLKILDTPQAIALAEEKARIKFINAPKNVEEYVLGIRAMRIY